MTASPAFRDAFSGARARYLNLLAVPPDADAVRRARLVYVARATRIAGGAVALPAAVLFALSSFSRAVPSILVLAGAWVVVGVAALVGGALALSRRAWFSLPPATGDALVDVARLEEEPPTACARAAAVRLETASMALPMVAAALLGPLTLHAPFALLWTGGAEHFAEWAGLSWIIVGHAHLALAIACVHYAYAARRLSDDELRRRRSRFEWKAYGATVLVSTIPGGILYGVPPLLTAVTGLLLNPIVFRTMTRWVLEERAMLRA